MLNDSSLQQCAFAQKNKVGKLQIVEVEIGGACTERIDPGEHPALSRDSIVYRDRQFARWICAIRFDIFDESKLETIARLKWFLNLGSREKPYAGKRGNFWAAWYQANGRSPRPSDRFSRRAFEGRMATVLVGDVAASHAQSSRDPENNYSVVRSVVRWESGCFQK